MNPMSSVRYSQPRVGGYVARSSFSALESPAVTPQASPCMRPVNAPMMTSPLASPKQAPAVPMQGFALPMASPMGLTYTGAPVMQQRTVVTSLPQSARSGQVVEPARSRTGSLVLLPDAQGTPPTAGMAATGPAPFVTSMGPRASVVFSQSPRGSVISQQSPRGSFTQSMPAGAIAASQSPRPSFTASMPPGAVAASQLPQQLQQPPTSSVNGRRHTVPGILPLGPGAPMLPMQAGVMAVEAGGGSPTGSWSTVPTKRRGSKPQVSSGAQAVAVKPVVSGDASRDDGNAVEIYYDQKELFYRGWQSGASQPRSVKARRKTDYQVAKRKTQSLRDRGFAPDLDDLDDGMA